MTPRSPSSTRSTRAKQRAQHPDVPVHRHDAARRGDRRQAARRQGPGDAQPGAAQRRDRERGVAQDARRRRHRGARQQSGVRPDAPEVDGASTTRSASSSRSTGSRRTSPRRATTRSSRRTSYEVAEMVACFDADWEHEDFTPHPESPLIWCPNNGRAARRRVHRRREALAVGAERALPGHGDHRAAGARGARAASRSTSWPSRRIRSSPTS